MNLSLELARRFRRNKGQNRVVSFISVSSTAGIGLGCFVLIVLLSVMNGFEKELRDRLLTIIPHGELFSVSNRGIVDWQIQQHSLMSDPRVRDIQPYTKLTAMIQQGSHLKAVELTGVLPTQNNFEFWRQAVSEQTWLALKDTQKGLVLGKGIVEKLNLDIGDAVTVLVPETSDSLTFKAPKRLSLNLVGVLNFGGELDNLIGLTALETASDAANVTSGAHGLRFMLEDPYSAYDVMRDIGYEFPQAVYMSDWTRTQGHLYNDIKLVRMVVYLALTLVIAVACFNIVSSLMMAVRDKHASIAILKTMGASNGLIVATFVWQGLINALVGIVIGTLSALLVAPNLAFIVKSAEQFTGIHILSGDIYFINFLPSQLLAQDVFLTVTIALLLSIISTIYPALKAAKVEPAQTL